MQRVYYQVISSNRCTEDNFAYTAYGIEANTPDGPFRLEDISSRKDFVVNIAFCFNVIGLNVDEVIPAVTTILS